MKSKKLVSILTIAMTMGTLLFGCSGQSSPASSAASQAVASSSAASGEASSGTASSDKPAAGLKVAAVLGGPITDKSWNQSAYNGLMAIGELGAETSFVEGCAASEAPDAIRTFASEGYNVVYVNSAAFKDSAYEIAAEFPDVFFIINSAGKSGENFVSLSSANYEQGFVQGVLCATISKSGKVGMVCGTEMTPILDAEAGFYQGVEYVNKELSRNVAYKATYLGNFEDTNAGYETALSFIAEGYDAMTTNADNASNAVLQACEEKGVYCAGNGVGQSEIAPNKLLAGVKVDNKATYLHSFQEYLDGTILENAGKETYGANFGVVAVDQFYKAADDFTAEEKQFVDDTIAKLAAGEIVVKPMAEYKKA